jgi:hypothetical protein
VLHVKQHLNGCASRPIWPLPKREIGDVSIRDRANPHVRREWSDPVLLETGVANVIHESAKPEEQWITETTTQIGEWRSKAHSTYMRWALSINGLLVAERTYRDWPAEKQFYVTSLRWRDRQRFGCRSRSGAVPKQPITIELPPN